MSGEGAPPPAGVGEKSEQLTHELAEVLKEEKREPVDTPDAVRKEENLILKMLARIESRNGSREIMRKDADGNIIKEEITDYDKAQEFQKELDDIGLADVKFRATEKGDKATNIWVGKEDMSTVFDENFADTMEYKTDRARDLRRIRLYNLRVKIRRWLGDDIPWDEDLSDRSMTPEKLEKRFESDE